MDWRRTPEPNLFSLSLHSRSLVLFGTVPTNSPYHASGRRGDARSRLYAIPRCRLGERGLPYGAYRAVAPAWWTRRRIFYVFRGRRSLPANSSTRISRVPSCGGGDRAPCWGEQRTCCRSIEPRVGVQSHPLYRETFLSGQALAHERVDRG